MRPRSIERGKLFADRVVYRFLVRFNEAAFNRTRKVNGTNQEPTFFTRFNEAAFNRTRKAGTTARRDATVARFNEAAFNRTRKVRVGKMKVAPRG